MGDLGPEGEHIVIRERVRQSKRKRPCFLEVRNERPEDARGDGSAAALRNSETWSYVRKESTDIPSSEMFSASATACPATREAAAEQRDWGIG